MLIYDCEQGDAARMHIPVAFKEVLPLFLIGHLALGAIFVLHIIFHVGWRLIIAAAVYGASIVGLRFLAGWGFNRPVISFLTPIGSGVRPLTLAASVGPGLTLLRHHATFAGASDRTNRSTINA